MVVLELAQPGQLIITVEEVRRSPNLFFLCSEINWVENKVTYLDLNITVDSIGSLQTDMYTKPNAKNSLLLPSSCHRPTVTQSSVYCLALRICRICSSEETAERQFGELAVRLRQREYSEAVIQAGIARARSVSREEAL